MPAGALPKGRKAEAPEIAARPLNAQLFGVLGATVAAVVAVAISGSAFAAEPDAPEGADDAVDLDAELMVSDAALKRWLDEGVAAAEDGAHLQAALRFQQVLDSAPAGHAIRDNAQFLQGASLVELELYHSALGAFSPIIDRGADHPRYERTLAYLLRVARQSAGDPSVMFQLAQFPTEVYPPDDAGELHFLVGQYLYGEAQLRQARERFAQVEPSAGPFFVRARYLDGVILVAQSGLGTEATEVDDEKLTAAADAFKMVLRHQRDVGGGDVVDAVAEQAILALGRLFYSTRQYDVAIDYYGELPRDSPHWLNALYEVSWVRFQLKQYPQALGNLHTLNSPYFVDQYYPESRVLQALILFYNCHYDASDLIVKQFVEDYFPLMERLRDEVNQFADPNAFYHWLARLARAEDTAFSERFQRIFNAALADKKLRRRFDLVARLNAELGRIEALREETEVPSSGLLSQLEASVKSYRSLVIGETGALAQTRLLRVLKGLRRHLGGALKIRQETLKARRGDSPDSIVQEQLSAAASDAEIEVHDEQIEWPFTGEYWRDELGSYLFDLDSRCDGTSEEVGT